MNRLAWGVAGVALLLGLGVGAASAQEAVVGADTHAASPSIRWVAPGQESQPAPGTTPKPPKAATSSHKFWDTENLLLFSGVGIGRGLDYASTLNMRRRGINEVFLTNAIVDNHPLFVGFELGASAISIGASYVFHRTGHHRVERWISVVHIGLALGGAGRNYALPTPHPM